MGLKNTIFKYTLENDKIVITGAIKISQTIEIPETIDNYPVKAIAKNAFRRADVKNVINKAVDLTVGVEAFRQSSLRSWVNKKNGSVSCVKAKAFFEAKRLRFFEFNSKECEIQNEAFRYCKNLYSVKLPEVLHKCGYNTFRDTKFYTTEDNSWAISKDGYILNYKIKDDILTVPSEVKNLRSNDLSKTINIKCLRVDSSQLTDRCLANSNIERVYITGNKPIPTACFLDCRNLKAVNLSNDIKRIKEDAFNGCRMLKTIMLPESLRVIETYAFKNCITLSLIRFNNKLITIKQFAFENCHSLRDVYIPDSIKNLSYRAFYNCLNLRRLVTLGRNSYSKDINMIKGCPNLKELKLPKSCV